MFYMSRNLLDRALKPRAGGVSQWGILGAEEERERSKWRLEANRTINGKREVERQNPFRFPIDIY